jgi:type I restriction enzyme S subunit
MNFRFLTFALESEWVFDQASRSATGIAQKTVPLSGLRSILVPIPPLAEQQRIAKKLEEVFSLCDRLECHLATKNTESSRLLEAVLSKALQYASSGDSTESNAETPQVL